MDLPVGISTLQNTDRWIGSIICAFLTLVRRIVEPRVPEVRPVHRILFVKFAEQGSTVLAHEAICRAIDLVGRENVYFVVFEDNRFILDAMNVIPAENVITISIRSPFALAAGAVRAIMRARKIDIDAVVDLEFFTRFSAAVTFLSGAKSRVGFHTFFGEGPYRGDLMTHRLLYNPHLHTSDMFASMVEALTRDPAMLPTFDFKPSGAPRTPMFQPRPNESAELEALLQRECPQLGASPLILFNPNAGDLLPLRRWPAQRYVDLARLLLAHYPDLYIAFTGAPNEAGAVNHLARQVNSPRVIALAGKTTLRQILVLYLRSRVLVTNDSGPAHFASMTPIQVVTLFGPETPELFGARSASAHVLYRGIACSPCVNAFNNRQTVCRNNVCMQMISVEDVFEKVTSIYDKIDIVSR